MAREPYVDFMGSMRYVSFLILADPLRYITCCNAIRLHFRANQLRRTLRPLPNAPPH
jgi:hypothetical protein